MASVFVNEPVLVIPARLTGLLVLRCRLAEYYRDHRGRDPELDELLVALGQAALASRGHRVNTDPGTSGDHDGEQRPPSRMSTREAADRLRVSDRAVRAAITRGRLPAEVVGGRWLLDPADVDAYGRRRVS